MIELLKKPSKLTDNNQEIVCKMIITRQEFGKY